MDFSDVINASVQEVWNVIKQPADIVTEGISKIKKQDDLHWIQPEGDVDNVFSATLKEESYEVHVVSVSSKYKSEGTDIVLSLEDAKGGCKVNVHYVVRTTAILNMIVLKTMGEKLEHHASNVIIKNIKKAVK